MERKTRVRNRPKEEERREKEIPGREINQERGPCSAGSNPIQKKGPNLFLIGDEL
jgi:hypothetical protein